MTRKIICEINGLDVLVNLELAGDSSAEEVTRDLNEFLKCYEIGDINPERGFYVQCDSCTREDGMKNTWINIFLPKTKKDVFFVSAKVVSHNTEYQLLNAYTDKVDLTKCGENGFTKYSVQKFDGEKW